jgi:hypothetical protein
MACGCAPPAARTSEPVKLLPDSVRHLLARCEENAKSPPKVGTSLGSYFDVVRVVIENIKPCSRNDRSLVKKEEIATSFWVRCRFLGDSRVIETWRRNGSIEALFVPSVAASKGVVEKSVLGVNVGSECSVIVQVGLIPLYGVRLVHWVTTVPE